MFLNKKKLEKDKILNNLIYYTIFSLIYTYYFHTCKPIKKLPNFLSIYLSN